MKNLIVTVLLGVLFISCGTENEPTYKLTTTVSPTEGGTISPSTGVFPKDEVVTLTGTPSTGWRFVRWEGDWEGEINPVNLGMTRDFNVIGVFERKNYSLNITIEGEGTVEERVVQQKSTEYPYETIVELTPIPSEGWEFVEWGGDLSGSEVPKLVTVGTQTEILVVFEKINYPITITIFGNGIVDIEPQLELYPHGTQVTLTPKPSEGWRFFEWGGDLDGTIVPTQITVENEMNIIVNFSELNDTSLNDGLIVWFPFDGFLSGSDNETEGSNFGVVYSTDRTGKDNSSLLFNSIDNYIDFGTNQNFGVTSSGSLTISFWTLLTNEKGVPIYKYHHLNSGGSNFGILYGSSSIQVIGNGRNSTVYNGSIELNTWYNITVTFDKSNIKIFKNGNLVHQGSVLMNSSIPNTPFQLNRSLGVLEYQRGTGKIDDLGIWNRVLTDDEVYILYSEGFTF